MSKKVSKNEGALIHAANKIRKAKGCTVPLFLQSVYIQYISVGAKGEVQNIKKDKVRLGCVIFSSQVYYTCQRLYRFHIINKRTAMNRYRKKASVDCRRKQHVVIVDSETDEAQSSRPVCKRVKNDGNSYPQEGLNPYQAIKQIPEITLTRAQMKADPIQIILKLQQKYREYGAVKIRACPQWNPPFNFKYTEKPITTRIQKIHRLKQGKAFDEKEEHYSIKTFTDFAQNYQKAYKFKFDRVGGTAQACMEQEFWHIVNGSGMQDGKVADKYKATIEYAADLPSHQFGSGFPQFQSPKFCDENFNYATNYWNLNNIYKSPSSILKITEKNNEKISGVTIPWVYMGMQFSTFCWHVEDLWLNSINYSHRGATKTWYVIPESYKEKFDEYVLKKTGKREFLNSITFMIDPIQLQENGIKVYKAYQRPREYILTLFNAYHSGFSQGFNVGQAVNVGTIESLGIIRKAQNYYSLNKKAHKPPVICYDWLVAANAGNSAVDQQTITTEYNRIVGNQANKMRAFMQNGCIVGSQTVEAGLKYDRLTCQTCKHYQYLSVLKCVQCQKKYCLQDADRCCGKGFVFVTRPLDKLRRRSLIQLRII